MDYLRKAPKLPVCSTTHQIVFCNNLIVMISVSRGNLSSHSEPFCLEEIVENVSRNYFYIKASGG